jgi:hypothetical protein
VRRRVHGPVSGLRVLGVSPVAALLASAMAAMFVLRLLPFPTTVEQIYATATLYAVQSSPLPYSPASLVLHPFVHLESNVLMLNDPFRPELFLIGAMMVGVDGLLVFVTGSLVAQMAGRGPLRAGAMPLVFFTGAAAGGQLLVWTSLDREVLAYGGAAPICALLAAFIVLAERAPATGPARRFLPAATVMLIAGISLPLLVDLLRLYERHSPWQLALGGAAAGFIIAPLIAPRRGD